jgi:thiol-disulfide isomerase/thioredoxin
MRITLLLAAAVCLLPLLSSAQQAPASPPAQPSAVEDLSQYQTADALWQHIQTLKHGPAKPPASPQEYRADLMNMISGLYNSVTEFLKRYPDDPRKWDAQLLEIQVHSRLGLIDGRIDEDGDAAQLRALASQSQAPESVRAQARYQLLGITLHNYLAQNRSTTAATVIDQLHQFAADFPSYPNLDVIKYQVAQALKKSDPVSYQALLGEVAASGRPNLAAAARAQLAAIQKLKSPLDLSFTAVDGSKVDLSAMRGKVVLIDFWASWCGPCRAEMPSVLAAYKNLHGKGFDIVGVSLDQDKQAMLNFINGNGMTWPQYFDGRGWQNQISSSYGIQEIPTMWLVNKKGYVATTDGRGDLEDQLEKLLAE